MKQVLIALTLLLIGGGVFFTLVANRELVEPYLIEWGLNPDGVWTRGTLKLIATVLIGAPIALGFWGIAALGSDQAGSDVHGYTVLRLRTGVRYFFSLAAFALAVLFIFVATNDSDELVFQIVMICFGCLFLFGGVWILIARIRYDNSTIFATDYTGVSRRHDWVDLETIDVRRDAQEYHLLFRTGRKVRISFFYQGANELIALAEDKLQAYARTSRG